MRFMLMVKGNEQIESGAPPSPELVAAMGKFNEEMVKAGVMLAAEGLHPSSKGALVTFSKGKPTVTDGPFAEAKELIGGYWLIQVKSREEAIAWAMRSPAPFGDDQPGQIEIRRVYEMEDFPPEVQAAAADEPALRAEIERQKEQRKGS